MKAFTELWAYRNLIWNLAQRELRARYKKSVLGWLWSLINPASSLLIYTVVFGTYLKVVPPVAGNGTTQSFAAYLFAGLVVWNAFYGTVTGAMGALSGAGPLLNKVYFPPACPAIANTLTVLLQAVIEATILALVMVLLGNVGPTFLLFIPLVALLAVFSIGIGLALSVFNVYYRDVGYLVGIGMNILFYATPIIYPITLVPEEVGGFPLRVVVAANPIAQFVQWSRDAFYLLVWPSPRAVLVLAAVSLVTFVVGTNVFSRMARNVAEEL